MKLRVKKIIEDHFGSIFTLSVVLGLLAPKFGVMLSQTVELLLMAMLLLSFLKVETVEVLHHIKSPLRLIYMLMVYLLIIPVIVFFLFKQVDPSLAIACLMLAALPPGVSTSALTGIIRGDIALSLTMTVLAHLIAPASMVALFFMLTKTVIQLDLAAIFVNLLLFIAIPLAMATAMRQIAPKTTAAAKNYSSAITIILVGLLVYIVVSAQAELILAEPSKVLVYFAWICLLFLLLHILGYFTLFFADKRQKLTSSLLKTYMNSALGIVLAYKFFTPEIALILVISEIPWALMFIPFKHYVDKQKLP